MTDTVSVPAILWLRQTLDSEVRNFLALRIANETSDLHQFLQLGFEDKIKKSLHDSGLLGENEIERFWYDIFIAAIRG